MELVPNEYTNGNTVKAV